MGAGVVSSRSKDTDDDCPFNQSFVLEPDTQNVSPPVHFLVWKKQSFRCVLAFMDRGG